ncbi:MAG: methylenetetrahydrofolate reductase [NAD(P)H] [Chitinophagales bacterium]
MKVTDFFKKDKTLISFEILPPLKGKSIESIYNILDPLMEFKPPFVDVTYHREDFIYKQTDKGYYEKIAIRKRPGTVGICAAIIHKYGIEAVPHLICGGFTKEETESALIDLNFLGIQNVLLLRGDARKMDRKFIPEEGGHHYAIDLVKQTVGLNNGIYLHEEVTGSVKTDFCIGVAGYPEKHFEAPNYEIDLDYLKQKVDAGANYIVTQMFFNNKKFFDFVEACRKAGINVPIIPGLKPITSHSQIDILPSIFFTDFPQDLISAVKACKDRDAVKEIGVEWTTQQCKELIEYGVPCIHFYTMGDWRTTKSIVEQIV